MTKGETVFQESGEHIEAKIEAAVDYKPRPLSQMLRELAERQDQEKVTIRCIREALADRSFATFLILTCLINLLPFPPGTTIVLGVPIVIVAVQMVVGAKTIWLPDFFLRMSLSQKAFHKMTTRIIPGLEKIERWVKPRNWPFSSAKQAERIIGVWALILGIAVVIPIPFGNWLPAFACAICGAALSERDGKLLAIGVVTGILSIIILIAMAIAIFLGVSWAIAG